MPNLTNSSLISVCIPVFNGERYIRQCIESVLLQSERNFELLIIDNCSTDKTLDICNEFKDSRIRILKNICNIGSIRNFNKCIENAIGELFILLPCDDLLLPGSLELFSHVFAKYPSVGIAFGSTVRIDSDEKTLGINKISEQNKYLSSKEAIRLIAEKFNPIQHPMVRTTIFEDVCNFDEKLGCFCDIDLWSRVLFHGWDAYALCKPLTALRSHANQGQALFLKQSKSNLKKLSSHFGKQLPPTFYRENHYNLLFFMFIQSFKRQVKVVFVEGKRLDDMITRGLIQSHCSNILFSIRHFNYASFRAEVLLFAKILKSIGLVRTFNLYFSVIRSYFLNC